jgi:ferric-dicitrate binding protein FerR (iron transport regulator)
MHKDYLHFTEKDFIADEHFQQWVKFPNAENESFWIPWITDHPEKKGCIKAAKAFVENLSFASTSPTPHEVEASLKQSLEKIALLETPITIKTISKRSHGRYIWLAAAVFFGCTITAGLLLRHHDPVTIEMVAGPQQIKTIVLPDSSIITLNEGAHITYISDMQNANMREVWLEGEAFFNVKHIEKNEKPTRFIVHSGDIDIEVLGTTFNVKKIGTVTNVSLNTGKIKVALKDDPNTTINLEPGDFVSYSAKEKRILKKQVKAELYSVWKEEKMELDNMPLFEIAGLLEDAYGYTIEIPDQKLANSKVSGTLYLKDESTLLETLAFTLNINIVKKDNVLSFQLKN